MLRRITAVSLCASVLMLLAGVSAFSQSNDVIDRLLNSEEARLNDALYLVSILSESASPDAEQAEALKAVDWGRYDITPDPSATITFGELSYLLMESLGMRGGLFYKLFPGPRYAARELRYLEIPAEAYYAGSVLSGTEVLRLSQRAAERVGGDR